MHSKYPKFTNESGSWFLKVEGTLVLAWQKAIKGLKFLHTCSTGCRIIGSRKQLSNAMIAVRR